MNTKKQKTISLLLVALFSSGLCYSDEQAPLTSQASPSKKQVAQFAFGSSGVYTRSQGQNFNGVGLDAKFTMPSDYAQAQSNLGFSLRRTFNSENVDRYDGLAHIDFSLSKIFFAGLLGGIQYIHSNQSGSSYLKPVLGLQTGLRLASWSRFEWSESAIWLMADYRHAAGSSGSLLLNNGSPENKASLASVGVYYSFAIVTSE